MHVKEIVAAEDALLKRKMSSCKYEQLYKDLDLLQTHEFIDKYYDYFGSLYQTKLLCIKFDAMMSTSFATALYATRWKRQISHKEHRDIEVKQNDNDE